MRSMVNSLVVALVVAGTAAFAQQQQPPAQGQGTQTQQAQAPRRPASPTGTAATQVGGEWSKDAEPRYTNGKWIEITYNRPILRGRTDIFGSGADYGKKVNAGSPVWRVGANQTTRLKTEVPLVFGGKTIPPGEYSLFVDLKPAAWTLIVSKQPFQEKYDPKDKSATWGSFNYDQAQDVLRVPMTLGKSPYSVEEFTIGFVDMTATGGKIAMWWEKDFATVPFSIGQ
jgi:hypothetical protein